MAALCINMKYSYDIISNQFITDDRSSGSAKIVLGVLHQLGRIKLSILIITLTCLIAGILLPILGTYLDMINLPPNVKCATGSLGFAALGILITIIVIPASAIIFYIIAYYKKKNLTLRYKNV